MNKLTSLIQLISAIYLWLIGACIGAMIISGAVVAPIIFNAYSYLPSLGITQYDSGILMTQIFIKLNYLLNFTAIIIIIYELSVFKSTIKPSIILLGINILSILLIFLFSLYYTPAILEAQNMGAAYTATPEFESIHTQSEMLFKILLVTLSISFVWRIVLLSKKSPTTTKVSTPRTRKKTA
ncbi:DUF4149 domain-containing protein [Helicobacter cappadocius]|uniref:DUF4149 domain-containing protein n=1 Tax=Helicobacter cappadocius TaxID=3063998 RepID=A0AA90PKX6_9HELI|nr:MULTISPECIES: DUF4149 domain-containing protein [unclassified Helicobacter]MDO7253037.1 DUF4149 domain-containing protein [Helicobacter sp. faydin-H75]MDP2538974.1 DUF4149 domain-containing protein [Helicobacter sp. faydin-H76]